MAEKTTIPALKEKAHYKAGKKDNAGRWEPYEDFIVPGSFQIRGPTRAWPHNYVKHFYTRKYSQLLFYNNPRLWLQTQGIDEASDEGKRYIAHHVATRMQGKLRRAA
jgi:hypothetical protein